jgi:hypothetical protein
LQDIVEEDLKEVALIEALPVASPCEIEWNLTSSITVQNVFLYSTSRLCEVYPMN